MFGRLCQITHRIAVLDVDPDVVRDDLTLSEIHELLPELRSLHELILVRLEELTDDATDDELLAIMDRLSELSTIGSDLATAADDLSVVVDDVGADRGTWTGDLGGEE